MRRPLKHCPEKSSAEIITPAGKSTAAEKRRQMTYLRETPPSAVDGCDEVADLVDQQGQSFQCRTVAGMRFDLAGAVGQRKGADAARRTREAMRKLEAFDGIRLQYPVADRQ